MSDRPTKVKAFKKPDGTFGQVRVELNDQEYADYLARGKEHEEKMKDYELNKNYYLREEEYKSKIYPKLEEALFKKDIGKDPSMMEALVTIKAEIDNKYPV
jgi:hypothetical protein